MGGIPLLPTIYTNYLTKKVKTYKILLASTPCSIYLLNSRRWKTE